MKPWKPRQKWKIRPVTKVKPSATLYDRDFKSEQEKNAAILERHEQDLLTVFKNAFAD